MDYRTLAKALEELTEEQKDMDVTVRVEDEYFPVKKLEIFNASESDALDDNHPILAITEED